MSATRAGGLKAAQTNKERQGDDWYSRIGGIGGKATARDGAIKGFAANPLLASRAGKLGGQIGRRGKKLTQKERSAIRQQFEYFQKQSDEQISRLSSRGVKRPW